MDSQPLPEILLRLREDPPQTDLPLATDGVLRYVWESRFGPMLIEAADGVVLVNGKRVAPASETQVERPRP